METIKAYVENVFRTLPENEEILRTKEEILNNMLEKYSELKASGKSEHEAVGIVISEFGNIDELLEEMNLLPKATQAPENTQTDKAFSSSNDSPLMSMKEVQEYLSLYTRAAKAIALGVALCILGVSLLLLFEQLYNDNIFRSVLIMDGDDLFGLISLFLFVAIAVGLFIQSGMSLSKYENVSKGIQLEKETLDYVEATKAGLQPAFTKNLIISVLMCVLSPVILIGGYTFVADECTYPVVVFLAVIAIPVYILVRSGIPMGSITTLLTAQQITPEDKKSNSITGTICGYIMLLATAIFLYFGFVENNWEYAPVIYATGGILCGVAAVIVKGITDVVKK